MPHPLARLSLLLSFVSGFVSCASAPPAAKAAPGAPAPERFTYRAVVVDVPPGASKLVLRVSLPVEAGALQSLRATGLVGNAPFEVAIPAEAGAFHGEHVDLRWDALGSAGHGAGRELSVATHGRPVELGLCFGLATGVEQKPVDVALLEQELARGTAVEIDERPAQGPRTRLERVK